jgi:chemotaxis protein methyltransferase CheR
MKHEVILPFFAKYIETNLGIVYAEHNYFQLENRLEEIAKKLSIASLEALYDTAKKGIAGDLKALLLDTATNNETSFFRDPKIFRAIETAILPQFVEKYGKTQKLLIWSAASSTGQEALSTAILINEWSKKNNTNLSFSILATDISERVLEKAKTAQYTQLEVQRGLPAPLMIRYFKKVDNDKWEASADLKKNIEYRKMNLKEDFAFASSFHIILCRNVLIYQKVESKIEIVKRLTDNLADDGYLILGSGESLLGIADGYEHCYIDGAVAYKKKNAAKKAA